MASTCLNIDTQASKEMVGESVSSVEELAPALVGTYAFALRKQRASHSRPRGVGDATAAVKDLFQMMRVEDTCPPPSSRPRRVMSLKRRVRLLSEESPAIVATPPLAPRTEAYVRTRFRCTRELHPQKVEGENVSNQADETPESRYSSTSLCHGATDGSCMW